MNLESKIKALVGPIMVIGASGFIGANILRACLAVRKDVVGTIFAGDRWRLRGVPSVNLTYFDLHNPISVSSTFKQYSPMTVFDCSSFGSYSFEQDFKRIHATNYMSFILLMESVSEMRLAAFVHAGSSSEYGRNASGPVESDMLYPNSHYAVSKAAASQAISYFGKQRGIPVVNLRLYSTYGPYEDSSRLIPTLCALSLEGKLPVLASPDVTRDFIYVGDVVYAFVTAALRMGPEVIGESFNIGTGRPTSLGDLSVIAKELFHISEEPRFDQAEGRAWDVDNWYANLDKSKAVLQWQPKIDLHEGLLLTKQWWKEHLVDAKLSMMTKKTQGVRPKNFVSVIVACYRDAQAIPIMYNRLADVFNHLCIDYEIIFVNDCSPDNSEEIIREISAHDPNVIGITHSRNFGSQAAFRSGMELAHGEACVLMDGDLQDPPELIADFVKEWRNGADVVYGRRVKRDMPYLLEACYRLFYTFLAAMSEVPIPRNAGDFSLMDRSVVYWMLQCQERDAFLRGLRAYVGFNQVGVDYIRPERTFGRSTNNWLKNIGWAKKGIFAFSRMPLHILTAFGGVATVASCVMTIFSVATRLLFPEEVPHGITYISLLVSFFGSATILGLGLLGEYIGKIFEESKARPPFIRRCLITRGEINFVNMRKSDR